MMNENHEQIRRWLQSVGMRAFVNCFEVAKRNKESQGSYWDITPEEILSCDPKLTGTDLGGIYIRRSTIKSIFNEGGECQALQMCIDGKNFSNISPKEHNKALNLLQPKYCSGNKNN